MTCSMLLSQSRSVAELCESKIVRLWAVTVILREEAKGNTREDPFSFEERTAQA